MASSEDTEITLGTGKLLVMFFVLVAICAGSFSLGYKLGSKSESTLSSAAGTMSVTSGGSKPASTNPASAPPTLYKPVEQKSGTPDASTATTDKPVAPAEGGNGDNPSAASNPSANAGTNASDPGVTLPTTSYFVQVAAVSKQEDADALVDALKKKDYPAFVAANAATDKLFRIQVGPFTDIKEAEAMRTRLIGDGYNPIVKK
jgi:DedD protein